MYLLQGKYHNHPDQVKGCTFLTVLQLKLDLGGHMLRDYGFTFQSHFRFIGF